MCSSCKTTTSPEWRRGPDGSKSLCNACGLRYSKMKRGLGGDFERKKNQKRKRQKSTPNSNSSTPSTNPTMATFSTPNSSSSQPNTSSPWISSSSPKINTKSPTSVSTLSSSPAVIHHRSPSSQV